MIPNKLGVPVRSLLAAAVTCASLVPSTGVRAQEPFPGTSDEVVLSTARPATARAAVVPRITSMRRTWTGSVQERVRIDIRFSQNVTGFTIDDIDVSAGADIVPPLNGSGSSYSLNLTTQQDYDGPVIVKIPSGVAQNRLLEGNIGDHITFDVDNKAPSVLAAKVNGNELIVTFDEDLDESFIPSVTDFAVSFIRDAGFHRLDVSEVEVVARELFLILVRPVEVGDAVELFYNDRGTNAVRDLVGNRVGLVDRTVRNDTRSGGSTQVPDAPRNLSAVAAGSTAIELDWDAPLDDGGRGITGYLIEVSTDDGDTWSSLVRNTRRTATRYRHTGLTAGTTRHYRVSAINSNGAGDSSNVDSATTQERVPNAPRRLTASAMGTSTIELDWTAPSSGSGGPITGYRIEESPNGNSRWTVLEADTDSRTTEYTHTRLNPGTTRHYRVAAINGAGRGNWSSVAHATTDITAPDAPSGLSAVPSGLGGSNQLLLTWTRPSKDGGSSISGYLIEMSTNGSSGWTQVVANTRSTATNYVHIGLAPATTRFYRVAAINAQGEGEFSNVARGTTNAARPGQPRSLVARAAGPKSITLSWEAPSSDAGAAITGYSIRRRASNSSSWITIRTNTGSTVTTFPDTNLEPATAYLYQVAAINSVGRGQWSPEAGTRTNADVPGAPTNLTARAVGTSRINLSWTAPRNNGGAPVIGYRIEVSADGGTTWRIHRSNTGSVATTFSHTGLRPGSRRDYRISAVNTAGVGTPSRVDEATTEAVVPGAPRSLVARAAGSTAIELSWDAPTSDGGARITGYRIEASRNRNSGWTIVRANTQSSATTYRHTRLLAGNTWYYRVSAINVRGAGDFSNVATGTTKAGPPGQPRNLRAHATGPKSITLTWEAPSSDAGAAITGYSIQRRAFNSSYGMIPIRTGSTATTFQDTNLEPATAYLYQVAAINSVGAGQWSLEAGTRTNADVPGAPTNLTARAVGTSRINLSWTAPRNNGGAPVIGYRIEVSADGGTTWRIHRSNTGSVATTFSHTGLRPGSRRDYRISAVNTAGVGTPSRVDEATTEAVVPGAPRSLVARAAGSTAIELSWDAPTSDGGARITGYRIEASRNRNSGWTIVRANTQSSATTYRQTGLLAGNTWYYRVSAINGRGVGATSSVANATTDATVPGQPRTLRAAGTSPNAIELSWDAPASDGGAVIAGYRIEVATGAGGPWVALVPNSGSTTTAHTHTGLPPVTTRFYRVSAINSVGFGQPAGPVNATTLPALPAAPTRLTATARGTSQINLSWAAPTYDGGSRIIGYRIEVSADGRSTWNILRRNTGSTGTTFSHTNLQPATTRHYRVSAINVAGVGGASNVATATTEAIVPNAPRNLAARASGTSRIDLSWQPPTDDGGAQVTGYRVEVSDDGGATWENLVSNTRNTRTAYAHTGLAPATTRHYRVSAINRIGGSRASSIASATTDATVPDAPTGLVATATAPTQIDLAWAAPAYDGGAPITGYRIEVSETGATWIDLQPNSGSPGTSYSHTGLQPGSTRFYRVSAINVAGTGAASGVASAATDDPIERAGRLNTRVLPHVAAAMTSSTVSAIADRIDAVANGMGMERRMETGGLSSMAASLSAPGAGVVGLGRQDRSGLSSLFGGTSFQTPFGAADAPQQASTGTQVATWGAGEYHYLGEPGSTALDWSGNMVSAHVGVDGRVGSDILAGLAASYSSGTFDFTDRTGASPVTGTYGTTMTSVNPYLAWFSGDRGNAVWGTAGYGWGDIEVDDQREGLRTSPARTVTGAAGGSYQLLDSGIGGIRFKAEGWAGQVMVDGGERVDSVTLAMQRGKLALEWTQGFRSTAGHEVAIVLEGGMRYDNGDGVNGTSGEVGGGLRYNNADVGVTAEGRGRLVVSAREGYEEWGLGGMILFDPAARGQGLSIRLAPSYGDAASGVNQLWERGVSDADRDHDMGRAANLDGEVAYGVAGFQGTPYSGFYLAENGVRAFSSGVRYDLGAGLGLRLEGTRRESGFGAAEHSVGIRGRLRFR